MNRKLFTEEQQLLLYQKPYIYTITETRSNLTKEFQMIFMTAYKASKSPRKILEDQGFDISIIGERHIWGLSQHIRAEYQKHDKFHEGYGPQSTSAVLPSPADTNSQISETDEIRQLQHEIDYLKQEMEFLKKISNPGKDIK